VYFLQYGIRIEAARILRRTVASEILEPRHKMKMPSSVRVLLGICIGVVLGQIVYHFAGDDGILTVVLVFFLLYVFWLRKRKPKSSPPPVMKFCPNCGGFLQDGKCTNYQCSEGTNAPSGASG